MVHKRLSFWTILVSQQRRAFLAALVLVLLFSDCLINISHAQAGVLSQTANTQVSVHARLEIDAIHFDFPHVTSYLEITAPDSWKPFTALAGKTPGTDEYWQALLNLLLAVGLEYAPPREARLEGPTPADFGISKFIIHLEDRIESFDQKISVVPPFQVYPEDRNLVIVFAAESIHSEIPVNAEAQLRGMDADEVSDIDIEGRRGDFSFSDELVASWTLSPEGYHEGGKFKIPFLYKTLEQLVKSSYRLPAGKVVHIKTHHFMEKFGSLPAGASMQFNMEIEAPRDWPFVDGLRFNRNQKPLDPARLKLFLFTLQDWSPNELDGLVNGPVTLSNFSITDDSVHLSISNSERGFIPIVLQSRGRQDLIAGSAIDVHENRTLLYLKSGSSQPYPWLSQTVELELRDLDILSVTPLPDMDDGKGHLSWQLPGGIPAGQNPEIRVEVNTQAVTPLQRLFAGFIDPYSVINTINFILSLIFVFILFHILSPGHAKQESVFPVEARRLVRILYPLVLMLIILQLLFVSRSLFSLFSTTTSMEGWQKAANISFGLERAYGFYSVLSLVMFTLVATWQTRRRRTLGQLALWFLGVLLGAALAFPSGYSLFQLMGSKHHIALFSEAVLNYAGGVFEYTSLEQLPLSTILFIGYGVLIFGFTIFILAGFRQLLLDVMPGISLTQVTTRFHWTGRTTAWTFALLALAITTQWVFVRFQRMNPADWERLWIDFLIEEYAGSFASQLFALLPLFILAGVAVLLYHAGWSEDSPLVSTALQWCIPLAALMFGEFVSNTYLKVAGFSIPFGILIGFWALPYFLDTKLKRLQEWIDSKNSGGRHHKKLDLLANREEFLERAKALEDLEAKNDSIYRDYTRNSIDRETYHKQKQELQAQMKWIEAGGPNNLRVAKDQYLKIRGESLFRLPDFVSPRDLALSLGPAENWWQNGLLAAKFGLILSILPIGYFLYVLIVFRAKIILSTGSFGVIYLFKDLLFEIAFWLVAAFIMGMLYPYLRGRNGVIKGAFLGGVYGLVVAATVLLQTILNLGTRTNWLFPTLQLLLFWIILGVLLDRSTLNKYGLYWREIIDLYNLQDTRVLLGYLSPLALSLLGLAQQIISGAASASILTEVIKGISSALPNLP